MGAGETPGLARRFAIPLLIAVVTGALLTYACEVLWRVLATSSIDWAHRLSVPFLLWDSGVDFLSHVPLSLFVGWACGRYLQRKSQMISVGVGVVPLIWMVLQLCFLRWFRPEWDFPPDPPWRFAFVPLACLVAVPLGAKWGRRHRQRVRRVLASDH